MRMVERRETAGEAKRPSPRTTILIVDDHPVVREGLRAVLGRRAEFEVVGEAGDGQAAIALYERLRPDVAIVDLRLPGLGGIEAIGAICRIDPRARILVLTSFDGGAEVKNAVAAGASGFLLKGASGEELMAAVRKLRAGRKAVALLTSPPLSRREAEILELMALGLRNQEIADRLGLALGTVKLYVARLLETLDAKDRTEAVTLALRRGISHLL